MSSEKKPADWDSIEAHFRAGIRSLEDIGKEYGVTKGRISQVAKAKGWSRDLKAKIKAQADAKVERIEARKQAEEKALNDPTKQAKRRLTEADVVDSNAEAQVSIRMAHRKSIGRMRSMFEKLADEIEIETNNRELFERLGEMLDQSGTDDDGREIRDKLNEIYRKAISTPGRINSAKELTIILEKVVAMERKAFGIDEGEQGSNDIDELVRRINAE